MPALQPPTRDVQPSFLEAMTEFEVEGRGRPDDDSMVGHEIRSNRRTWADPRAFRAYTAALQADALPETPRAANWVQCTSLWWLDGDVYLGRLAIRHTLTPALLRTAGHIGYDVRPSARRRGHATAMPRASLPIARRLGIDSALLTCDRTNTGSRRVIEANGGVLENEVDGKLRFWVPTG